MANDGADREKEMLWLWMAGRLRAQAFEIERLRSVIQQIAEISPKPGGVGQIARDEMRLWK